jgi:uncharacterized protein YndB with AHSA1/START domain
MSVKKDPSGRRSVELEVEVPGTPEEVWQAIATGPGITAWFTPTDVEEREGGKICFHMGAGMDSSGIVTGWEPPIRFAYEEREWAPNAPPLATEMFVETKAGGTCIVRLVHSLFASTDDWDTQLEGMESGWPSFFRILRFYLTHFRGHSCSMIQLVESFSRTEAEAWDRLLTALGNRNIRVGDPLEVHIDGSSMKGIVEEIGKGNRPYDLFLRLTDPAPGIGQGWTSSWNGKVYVSISFYLYGDQASTIAKRDQLQWQDWFKKHFPVSS